MLFGNKNGHTHYASSLMRRQCSQIISTSSAQWTSTRLTGEVILIKCVMDLYQLITTSFAFRTCCQYLCYGLCISVVMCESYLPQTHLWLLSCSHMKMKLAIKLTVLGFPSWRVFLYFPWWEDFKHRRFILLGWGREKCVCVGQSIWKRYLVLVSCKCIYKLFSFTDPCSVLHSDEGLD